MSCPVLYTATFADAAQTFIAPRDGKIVGIRWAMTYKPAGDAASARAELSFAAASQFSTNEVNNVISQVEKETETLTSGGSSADHNEMIHLPIPVPIEAGEKIYLHAAVSGAAAGRIRVQLFIADGADSKTSPRRR